MTLTRVKIPSESVPFVVSITAQVISYVSNKGGKQENE